MLMPSTAITAVALLQLAAVAVALPIHNPHNVAIKVHQERDHQPKVPATCAERGSAAQSETASGVEEGAPSSIGFEVESLFALTPVPDSPESAASSSDPSVLAPPAPTVSSPNVLASPAPAASPSPQSSGWPSLPEPATIDDPAYVKLSNIISNVLDTAIAISTKSWELGTITQTLLEAYDSPLTPFAWKAEALSAPETSYVPKEVITITTKKLAQYHWSGAPANNTDSNLRKYLSPGTSKTPLQPRDLVNGDGALGDPASLGPATWILAHYANVAGDVNTTLQSPDAYAWAVGNQYAWLQQGPKQNGVISHRVDNWELWADQGYMIPPFIAYLGLTTNNEDLLREALAQWTGVTDVLLDTERSLYRHVTADWDRRFWLTGNAWMLMGLMRVISSIRAAGSAIDTSAAEATAARTFKALFDQANDVGLMPNYMFESDPSRIHPESAGTAGVVAAYYRFVKLNPTLAAPFRAQAERSFGGVVGKIGDNLWLKEVVDPSGKNGFRVDPTQEIRSAEGQSFVALMWAARTAAGL